ncbi:MAG TPA: methyltransferase domain-containing protein [Blastocatellia bacterium]|nr:methyltransferase domain-containing protein [Blastocatellia bacterium]
MTQTESNFDTRKAELFSLQLLDTINKAGIALMTSIGHQTGLFDTMAGLPPATSERIAKAAGLQERYVRKWLGAMVAGRVVEYDVEEKTYVLPPEHAAFLTRAASPNNLAVAAQFIPLLGAVEEKVIDAFINGGGVSYDHYPTFHRVMAEESEQTVVAGLLNSILPLVPDLPAKLEAGIEVLDIGCGSGRAINLMAKRFPRSKFTGYDLSLEAITNARSEAARLCLHNVRFEVQDIVEMQERDQFQLITAFDAIHDQAQPRQVLRAIYNALAPDGVFLMQDIRASSHVHKNLDHPLGAYLYTISCMHCMTVSLAQNGEGLGTAWGEEKALELLAEAGFQNVEVTTLAHDIINNYYLVRKGA